MSVLSDIDARSRAVFGKIVEAYIESGEPVGSRTLSRDSELNVSPATIRNVMADLTELGLLHAPHVSAGRMPTETGMRLFVDGLLQIGDLTREEREAIDASAGEGAMEDVLAKAASQLSGLTHSASLVVAQKSESALRHIEFIATSPGEALVVLVAEDGGVENRVIKTPVDLPSSALTMAGNYLSSRLRGRTMTEARAEILRELTTNRAELDALTSRLVREGVADLSGGAEPSLIVRGRGHLLDEATEQDLERVRMLFDDLERKQEVIDLLNAASDGEGVKIFIGSENRLFSLSGSSVIVAPYRDKSQKIVGALGVIGPTRLNYARVIPIVDYTAEVVTRLLK
ncbi:MAG: heat-inducible transcriptional repressor HrcA [Pseudomonadota bacterium]